MPMISKRIEKLEKANPNKTDRPIGNGLGDYYKWEASPEGQAALAEFYGPEEENKRLMAEYKEDLRQRGLLP